MRTSISQPLLLAILLVAVAPSFGAGQPYVDPEGGLRPFVGTSAFMLVNLVPSDDPPNFVQLNFGLRLSPNDTISLEAITWQHFRPLGIQYWQSGDPYPGKVRDFGVGVAYQRFLWRGAYAAVHAVPFVQQYIDEDGDVIQTGFQLFMTLRFGYHFSAFSDLFFVEPSIAFTSWVNTNVPASFQEQDDRWGSYFLFEPGLHFGFNL
jgi:hypothetical protein